MEALLLAAVMVLLCCIAREDIKTRLISVRFLVAMAIIRVLLALCAFFAEGVCGVPVCDSAGFAYVTASIKAISLNDMSVHALVLSCACAVVVMGLLKALEGFVKIVCNFRKSLQEDVRKNVRTRMKEHTRENAQEVLHESTRQNAQEVLHESPRQPITLLGTGDVLLVGVCCLFLTPFQIGLFLLLSMAFGVALGLYYLLRHGDKTFPFAPAIALAFGVAFCL